MKWVRAGLAVLVLLTGGCASYGVVENQSRSTAADEPRYSLREFQKRWETDDNAVMLAFSGGGTRAAALAYGVLKELRDTPLSAQNSSGHLLDEVHSISSVSGGSFTAAYYGLHGDRIFEDFEEVFLRRDVQGALLHRLFDPFHWFSGTGRTEMAVRYYGDAVFQNATFADLWNAGGPMILINTSDFGRGVRFSFIQEYFDLLCSDLSSFPLARAVTASSAVPVLFNPVVVQNHPDCGNELPGWLQRIGEQAAQDPELAMTVAGLTSYFDRSQLQYVHFVDGGITDNLGLRAFYDVVSLAGGAGHYLEGFKRIAPRRLVMISVNASTSRQSAMDQSPRLPSILDSISAMSDVQLHRYNTATITLVKHSLRKWAAQVATPERPVELYFILLDLQALRDPQQRHFLNQAPTSFSLTDEQVDGLIAAGGELLRSHPEFQRLLRDLAADAQIPGAKGETP